ncbi:glutathione-disulfide reductase [Piscinibacter defluvii]|uniref:glutathione-disulfide reductase n=1 Tax=Piscinibacter defluvii TaxID=1796922 RepID=UPI000FDE7DF6|nr:glutathione-disulfide reductase [Piscinibacter defluvii]
MDETSWDLFVIGAGSGGVRAARMAAQRGARVAIAEPGALGGTCVNVGCIPKKLYSFAAGYGAAFEQSRGYGWDPGTPAFDWAALKAARAREIARLNAVYEQLLRGAGATLLRGRARLAGPGQVEVDGVRHTARHVLVATGARPAALEIPGRELALSSDAMFDLPVFPRRLVVVGAGYIACEFASIFRGLGAQVTQVLRGDQVLRGFDEDLRRFLGHELRRQGVDLRSGCTPVAIERGADGLVVGLSDGTRLPADTVLLATGRVPNSAGLGLEALGVALRANGAIPVDEHFQTAVPGLHALGDVIGRVQLTPVAIAEAMVLVDRLFGRGGRRLDYTQIPTAVFTHPSVASVGLTEAQARERHGDAVRIYRSEFRPLRHTLSGDGERTLVKLVVDGASDRVLGLHMVGEEAGEIVQGFAVALSAGATKAQFDATVGIHPTVAEEFVTLREPVA